MRATLRHLGSHGALVAIAATTACAPITKKSTTYEKVISAADKAPAVEAKTRATIEAKKDELFVHLDHAGACGKVTVQKVHVYENEERTTNKFVHVMEYLLGVAGMGGGGFLLVYDAGNQQQLLPPEVDPDVVAYGALGAGAAFFLAGIIDSLLAEDRVHDRGIKEKVVGGTGTAADCVAQAAVGEPVALAIGGKYVPLGNTGADGTLHAAWPLVPFELVAGKTWPEHGALVAGPSDKVRPLVEGGKTLGAYALGDVNLAPLRAAAADKAWKDAEAAGGWASYRAFIEKFPEVRSAEAKEKLRKLRKPSLLVDLDAAITAKDAPRARTLVAEWREIDPQDPEIAAHEQPIAALERTLQIEKGYTELDAMMIRADAEPGSGAVVEATKVLGELAVLAPDDARFAPAQKRLVAARTKKLAKLTKDAGAAKDTSAFALLDEADKLAPGDKKLAALRTQITNREVDRRIAAAKAAEAKGNDAEATEQLAQAETIAPGNARIGRTRQDIAARKEKEAKRVAALEAQKQAADERKAKQLAEAEARKAKQQEEIERKQREREEAAQNKADAAAQKKEAIAKAKEDAERKKAEEAAKKQDEEDRARREAEAAAEKALADARAAGFMFEQRLDAQYRDVNVLQKATYPAECKVDYSSKRERPADCPDCAPRLFTRAELQCGGRGVALVKDQDMVRLSCRNMTCGECVQIVEPVLAPFAKGKIAVPKSCKASK